MNEHALEWMNMQRRDARTANHPKFGATLALGARMAPNFWGGGTT
jgi:hypothetical protein